MERFSKTFLLSSFIFRRERIRIVLYIVLISAFIVGMVPIFEEMLRTTPDTSVLVETMKNPAMVSMIGPVFVEDSYTTGSIYANYMSVYVGLMFAAWNILFTTRHTRLDEERGRMEIIKSLPVGDYANISGTITVSFIINLLVCLFLIVGFKALSPDMELKSIVNFSISTTVFGFLFTGITLIFAQISTSSTLTNSLSFLSLFAFYILRAVGDVSYEFLSLISPLGLMTRT